MTRLRLPDRRPAATLDSLWSRAGRAHALTVTVGFDPATGRALEVFAGGADGSDMAAIVSDACVIVSLALQSGTNPEDLGSSLLKVVDPLTGGTDHASPIGAIVAALAHETRQMEGAT